VERSPAQDGPGAEGSIASLVLEAAASLPAGVPRSTLAKLLVGSRSERLGDLTHHELYGRLADHRRDEIQPTIDRQIADGYLAFLDQSRPAVVITSHGRAALRGGTPHPPGDRSWRVPGPSREPTALPVMRRTGRTPDASETIARTYELYQAGLSPEQIAQRRRLAESTIAGHLAALITEGRVGVDELVLPEIQRQIDDAINRVGDERLAPIKEGLSPENSYGQIRWVIAGRRAADRRSQGD
jgi:uncharacterized protein YpbB